MRQSSPAVRAALCGHKHGIQLNMWQKRILNSARELVCLGELECCSLKDNSLQGSSLLPSVCWQRGEAVYRQDKSLLEARKVQLECIFQITLQKILN